MFIDIGRNRGFSLSARDSSDEKNGDEEKGERMKHKNSNVIGNRGRGRRTMKAPIEPDGGKK